MMNHGPPWEEITQHNFSIFTLWAEAWNFPVRTQHHQMSPTYSDVFTDRSEEGRTFLNN